MPHTEGYIEEPQVQGDPQGVDYQALYQKYYDKGFDVDKATRKLRILYGAGEPEITALTDFYASKKKSQDGPSASESSSETVSTDSTSDTTPQGGEESGDSAAPVTAPEPLDTIPPEGTPIPYGGVQLAQASVVSSGRPDGWQEDYKSRFGEGAVYELNTDRIFSEQRDPNLMAAVNVIEADAFGRWYNNRLKSGRTNELVQQYLSLEGNEDLRRQLLDERIPKHALKEGIINMFAALENAPEGQLTLSLIHI